MRETKFRGHTGETWIYGNLIVHHYSNDDHVQIESTNPDDPAQWDVDSWTVGQYTGLKDRDGVEVYEGDIVAVPVHDTPLSYGSSVNAGTEGMKVVWDSEYFRWALVSLFDSDDYGLCDFDESDIKVVGNTYDLADSGHTKTIQPPETDNLKC